MSPQEILYPQLISEESAGICVIAFKIVYVEADVRMLVGNFKICACNGIFFASDNALRALCAAQHCYLTCGCGFNVDVFAVEGKFENFGSFGCIEITFFKKIVKSLLTII